MQIRHMSIGDEEKRVMLNVNLILYDYTIDQLLNL